MERLSNKNPCNTCAVDRQIGNPYSWQCECDGCMKPGRWKDECVKKLEEYEDLEEQGKLLKLPVTAGSLVYEPYQFMGEGAWEIDVHKIRLKDLDKIGKTVFLTREEAEAALKELGKDKG